MKPRGISQVFYEILPKSLILSLIKSNLEWGRFCFLSAAFKRSTKNNASGNVCGTTMLNARVTRREDFQNLRFKCVLV